MNNLTFAHPQQALQHFFRRSALQSLTLAGLLLCGVQALWLALLALIAFSFRNDPELASGNWLPSAAWTYLQLQNMLYALFSGSLIAAALPGLLLTTHGEWLFTRSLSRWNVFTLARRVYLQIWGALTLAMVGLTALSHVLVKTSGYEMSWLATAFISSFSLYLACLTAGGLPLIYRQMTPLALLAVWCIGSGFIPAQPQWAWVAPAAITALWLTCLGSALIQVQRLYKNQAFSPTPTHLEQHSNIAPLYQEIPLPWHRPATALGKLSQKWARLQLLTRHSQMVYQHLLLGGLVLGFAQILWSSYRQFQPGHYFNGPGLIFDVIYAVLFCCVAFVLFSPQALIRRYREYFLTRPVTPAQLYLSQWGVQGAAVLGLLLMGMGVGLMVGLSNPPNLPYVQEMPALLNIHVILAMGAFLWLGGEYVVIFLLVACLLTVGLSPLLQLGVLITTPSLSAGLLWSIVLSIRGLDLRHFQHPIPRTQWAAKTLITSLLLGAVTFWGAQQHPLLNFVTLAQGVEQYPDERLERQKQVAQALIAPAAGYIDDRAYLDNTDWNNPLEPARWGVQTPILEGLLKRPYDPAAAGEMLENLLAPAVKPLREEYRTYRHQHTDSWNAQRRAYYQRVTAFWQPLLTSQPEIDYGLQSQAAFAQDNYPKALQLAQQALAEVERKNPGPQANSDQQREYTSTLRVHMNKLAEIQGWLLQNRQAAATYQTLQKQGYRWSYRALGNLYLEMDQPAAALDMYLRDLSQCSDASCYSLRGRTQRLQLVLYFYPELCPTALTALKGKLFKSPVLRGLHTQTTAVCAKPARQDKAFAPIQALAAQGQWAQAEKQVRALLRPARLEPYQIQQPNYVTAGGLNPLRGQWEATRYALLLEAEYRQRGQVTTAYALYWLLQHPQPQLSSIAQWLNPAQHQELVQTQQALNQLYQAFAQAGSGFRTHYLSRTLVMQSLADTLPPALQTPALTAAVKTLRQAEQQVTAATRVGVF